MFNLRQASRTAALVALALTLPTFGGAAEVLAGATGTSHIGITKIASLSVARMETDQLYADQSHQAMSLGACMQSSGEPIPYRISASSLMGQEAFQVSHAEDQSNISYEVVWSDDNGQYRLTDSTDITDVVQVSANASCDVRRLSVELDTGTHASASSSRHTDVLSLILVIE